MKLSSLLNYDSITIQCHDNPDADSIASGFALMKYLEFWGKSVDLIYSGNYQIQKSNLLLMVDKLDIPIRYVQEIENTDLLITVDCQYGGGNITRFDADNIAVIDHHQIYATLPELNEVNSTLGACSTLVYELLKRENFDINSDSKIATSLYYGLYTDTSYFSEIYHPLDKDLRDEAQFDKLCFAMLKNSNISFEELVIAGEALTNYEYVEDHRYGIVQTRPCDPNILGIVSDMFLEVDAVDSCLVYSILPFGVKFSVRSCIKEVNAGELSAYISHGIGSGGGHMGKGGGFIQPDLLDDENIPDVIAKRMFDYYSETEIIYSESFEPDLSTFNIYIKKHLPVGYVPIKDVIPLGQTAIIRTMEGDIEIESKEDVNIIIGIRGEAYPCNPLQFKNSYTATDEPYTFKGDYAPHLKKPSTGEKIYLLPYAKACYSTGSAKIYAKPITSRVKLFTAWDNEKYMLGKPGDFLAIRHDAPEDVYIIDKSVFFKTYDCEKDL